MRFLIFNFFLFLSLPILGQQNGIRLNFKSFLNYERGIIVNDTSILIPPQLKEDNKTTFYDISINYMRTIKEITLIGGVGINWNKNDFSSTGNKITYLRSERILRKQKGLQAHLGILKTIPSTYNRVEFNVGTTLAFEYRFEKKYLSNFDRLDLNEIFLDGQELKIDYSNLWTVGPTIELGIYFRVIKDIFIGINHHSWFYLQKEKGIDLFEVHQFGLNRTLLNNSKSERIVNKKIFGKNNLFSYSVLLKF